MEGLEKIVVKRQIPVIHILLSVEKEFDTNQLGLVQQTKKLQQTYDKLLLSVTKNCKITFVTVTKRSMAKSFGKQKLSVLRLEAVKKARAEVKSITNTKVIRTEKYVPINN